ncbi:MAG: DUF4440 domain-containing protein [Leptolyngbya sp. SIO1D8]|nr:DUF4440 domain-containing protein [Leptolyngbya sp. SIO1D8]
MTNIELIKEFYRSFQEHDDTAFRRICTQDLEWIQNEGLPHRAVHKGAEAVFEKIFQRGHGTLKDCVYHIERILEAGSAVVVMGHYEGQSTSEKNLKGEAHVYDIRDDKVCRLRMFADTHPMWEVMSTAS